MHPQPSLVCEATVAMGCDLGCMRSEWWGWILPLLQHIPAQGE